MKTKSIKIMSVFLILLGIYSCSKNDGSLTDYSNLVSFKGDLGTEQVSMSKPDCRSQYGASYWSDDSIGYSSQLFNNYNRISLSVRPIKKSDFNNTFKLGKYRIGTDYNIVLYNEGNHYMSNPLSNDSIELVQIDRLANNLILCSYRFECNLYKPNGDYYYRINDGYLVTIFGEIYDEFSHQ